MLLGGIPEQLIMGDDHGGRYCEHRSIGDTERPSYTAGFGLHVWVRSPREDDPVWCVVCQACERLPIFRVPAPGQHSRCPVVSLWRSGQAAHDAAQMHALEHRFAAKKFNERRSIMYGRQHRLERALAD
jgi:hypothetical protein